MNVTEAQARLQSIQQVLKFDPLSAAENLTGNSYKTDPVTEAIGMAGFFGHNKRKEDILAKATDTHFGMTLDYAEDLFDRRGFDVIYQEEFVGSYGPDRYVVRWHPRGLLVEYDTFGGNRVNGGKVRYNWRPSPELSDSDRWSLTSSGRFVIHTDEDQVWSGDHDIREGFFTNMTLLGLNGEFLPEWIDRPHMWFLNYAEEHALPQGPGTWEESRRMVEAINEAKISQFPQHVREAITP